MSNVTKRKTCVLYLTATCNLKCRYCYIDKSPILQQIDKLLEDTYNTDYYFNFMQQIFPDKAQLQEMEFWGGEPSYGLPRAIPTVKKALNYYHNLHHFMMSTNLTTDRWWDDFSSFIKIFKDYPERQFTFQLQLSLDGPTYINDENRGSGVTELFSKNFSKLLFNIETLLNEVPNVRIRAHFKPTLDSKSIAHLQTKEAIIKYYQFFEKYKELSQQYVSHHHWHLDLPTPNTAVPTPHTSEEGKMFANLCKLAYEAQAENAEKSHFKYFTNIVPFAKRSMAPIVKRTCLDCGATTCGTGSLVVGLLPNNMVSTCHNGFVDLISEYKNQAMQEKENRSLDFSFFNSKNFNNAVAFSVEEYETYYENMVNCYDRKARFPIIEFASQIQMYAKLGQIDAQYENVEKSIEAAHFLVQTTSNCLRDNLNTTGSHYLHHPGLMKLLLNGAKEWIENANKDFSTGTK